jgi:hypothetical protein
MAGYGEYETFEELHRGALTTVWKARCRGGPADEIFAVKVCHPSPWAEEGVEKAALFADLEEQVGDLKALAGKGARGWAPVLASGESEEEAWWATRHFPRSLERVIEGRAQLEGADIQWLAVSVVRGLMELEGHLHRPHGALKPANIFIDGVGRVRGSPILLSDPKPRSELGEAADRAADFHALGRIVVHLVRRQHANLQAAIGWPIEPGAEWRRLGRRAEGWRALCNVLLNPNPATHEHDWAAIEERLLRLEGGERPRWVTVVSVAGPLVLVLGGGVTYLRTWPFLEIPPALQPLAEMAGNRDLVVVEQMPVEWAPLCRAYYNWLGGFMRALDDRSKTAAWRRDAYLRDRVLDTLAMAGRDLGSLDPRRLASLGGGDLETLAGQNIDAVKKGATLLRVQKAYTMVRAAHEAFLEWPERKRLAELASDCRQRGWGRAADALQAVVDRGAPAPGDPAALTEISPENIDEILRSSGAAARFATLRDELQRRAGILAGGGDPVMAGLLDYLGRGAGEASDLEAASRAMEAAVADCSRWLALVQDGAGKPRFDRERFARESALRGFSGPVTAEVLAQWEREIEGYQFVAEADDPRRGAGWKEAVSSLEAKIAEIARESGNQPEAAGAAEAFTRTLADTRASIGALEARSILRKDVPELARDTSALSAALERFGRDVSDVHARIVPKPEAWLAVARGASFGAEGSPVAREWRARRDELVGTVRPPELERDKAAFSRLRQRYNALERFFREIASERGVGAFAVFDRSGIGEPFAGPLESWAEAQAREAATAWLRLVRWDGGVPGEDAATFLARPDAAGVPRRHAEVVARAAECGRAFTAAAARLAEGFGLDDPAVAALEAWRTEAVVGALGGEPAFRDVLETVRTLGQLRTETRPEALRAAAESPSLSVAWAAWRALGAGGTWPAAADLEAEARLERDLERRSAEAVRDPERLGALRREIAEEAPRRWKAAFRGARDGPAMAAALERIGAFGVDEERLEAGDKFNLLLHRLKQEDVRTLDGQALVDKRDGIVRACETLFGGRPPPDVIEWLFKVRSLDLGDPKREDSTMLGLGPVKAGWVAKELGDGSGGCEYRWTGRSGAHVLRFLPVEGEGVAPFFLCTTELPVGLVLDLAADPKTGKALQAHLAAAVEDGEDIRAGPRVWKLDPRRGILLADEWTGFAFPTWPTPLYAPAVAAPGKPEDSMPMQYLPPSAALFLARDVLRCRLPTPEEWAVVRRMARAEAASANVRDRVWQTQRDYLADRGVPDHQSPLDADIFWPDAKGQLPRGRQAGPVAPERSDEVLWFAPVNRAGEGPFLALAGNVAEYLMSEAESGAVFYVTGGSALAPPEVDPANFYPLPKAMPAIGFADVGLRLALNAPGNLVGRNRLHILIRAQPYLRL